MNEDEEEESMAMVPGLSLRDLSEGALSSILSRVLAAAEAGLKSAGADDDDGDVSPSGAAAGEDEDADGKTQHKRSEVSSSIAVCARSRDMGSAIAMLKKAIAAANGGSGSGAKTKEERAEEEEAYANVAHRTNAVGSVDSLIQSHAFYYVAHRVDLVALVEGSSSLAAPAPTQEAAATEGAGLEKAKLDPRVEKAMRRAGANVTLMIRAPVEFQNALACEILYEIGIPKSIAQGTWAAGGLGRGASSAVPDTPIKRGLGGLFRKKEAPAPTGFVDESTNVHYGPDDVAVFSTGSLGPAQILSLLFAHPDPPALPFLVRASAAANASGGSRSRARYKQRLTASRYVRALSVRFRVPDSGFDWSPWVGLWTPHASKAREEQLHLIPVMGGTLYALPPISLAFSDASSLTQPLKLSDGAGGTSTLHTEHAVTSAALTLADEGDMGAEGDGDVAAAGGKAGAAASAVGKPRRKIPTYTLTLSLFCRYWICNATGLPLMYSTSVYKSGASASSKEKSIRTVRVAAGQAQPVAEEVFENQRFLMFKWTSSLLPTDRVSWSDRFGTWKVSKPLDAFQLPVGDWSWTGPWEADKRGGEVDAEGWQYNIDFPRTSDTGWVPVRTAAHFVRRRRWLRRRLPPEGSEEAVQVQASLVGPSPGLPMLEDSHEGSRKPGADAYGSDDDDASDYMDDGVRLIEAKASTLLSMGLYMYGPEPGSEDQCAVRIGDSDWSLPFPLRNIGRAGLVVVKDKSVRGEVAAAGTNVSRRRLLDDDKPALQHQYELAVSAKPCSTVGESDGIPLGPSFHRSILVTLSPRLVFVNQLDAHLVAALSGVQDTLLENFGLPPGTAMERVGMYFLQVAQAAPHGPDGLSRLRPEIATHLDSIAVSEPVPGLEKGYDIGYPLHRKLGLSACCTGDGFIKPTIGKDGLIQNRRLSAQGSMVPTVLTVPPGEHGAYNWPVLPDASKPVASNSQVMVRVVCLVRKAPKRDSSQVATPAAPAVDERAKVLRSTFSSRRNIPTDAYAADASSSSTRVMTNLADAAMNGETVVLPVTDWSGCFDVGQVNDIPIQVPLKGKPGDGRQAGVILRVSVRAHRSRGSAVVLVSADSGLQPAANTVLDVLSKEEGRTGTYALTGPLADEEVQTQLAPVLWEHGRGETIVQDVLASVRNQVTLVKDLVRSSGSTKAVPPTAEDVIVGPSLRVPPPMFRVDNNSLDAFIIMQRGVDHNRRAPMRVPPLSSVVFAWNEPEIPDLMVFSDLTSEKEQKTTTGTAIVSALGMTKLVNAFSGDAGTTANTPRGKLQVVLRPTTVALGKTSSSIEDAPIVDIDINLISKHYSVDLPAGRVLEDETGDTSALAGASAAAAAAVAAGRKAASFDTPMYIRTRSEGRAWTVSEPRDSSSAWMVAQLPDGTLTNALSSYTSRPNIIISAGGNIITAACLAGGIENALTTAAGTGSGVPFVLENVSSMFGLDSMSGGTGRAASRTAGVAASPNGSGAPPVPIRYGDLVMIRHDVFSSAGAEEALSGGESGEDIRGAGDTLSLYLTCFRDGRVEWLQQEAALAVARQVVGVKAHGKEGFYTAPAAGSVFMVVGGRVGTFLRMVRSDGASASDLAGKRKKTAQDPLAEEEGGLGADGKNKNPQTFGLSPIAFGDRLLECCEIADDNMQLRFDADSRFVIRQCCLPPLTAALGTDSSSAGRPSGPGNAERNDDAAGDRVVSAFQLRRLAARGIKMRGDLVAEESQIALPVSGIPDVCTGATSIGKLLRLPEGSSSDVVSASRRSRQTVDAARGNDSPPVASVEDLRAAILRLPYPEALPNTCGLSMFPLASQTLPPRALVATVGFDGPTRVITIHARTKEAATAQGKKARKGRNDDEELVPSPASLSRPMSPGASAISLFSFQLRTYLPGICLSLVDASPQELLLLSIEDISASLSIVQPHTILELSIQEIQIDNQLSAATFPVVFGRSINQQQQRLLANEGAEATASPASGAGSGGPVDAEAEAAYQIALRPLIEFAIVHQTHKAISALPASQRNKGRRSGNGNQAEGVGAGPKAGILHFPYFSLLIQELDLSVEESLIKRIIGIVPPELSQMGGGGDDDGYDSDDNEIVSKRKGGILSDAVSSGVQKTAAAPLGLSAVMNLTTAARDKLAQTIVKTTAKKKRPSRSQELAMGGAGGAGVFDVSSWVAWGGKGSAMLAGMAKKATRRAARDLRAIDRLQRKALKAVVKGAGTMQHAMESQVKAVANLGNKQQKQDGPVRAISGPTVAGRGTGGAGREATALARAEAMLGLSRSGVGMAAGQRATLELQSAALKMLENSDKCGWASEKADTVSALAADVHWWWPSRLPVQDIMNESSDVRIYVQHLVLHSIAANVSFVRDMSIVSQSSPTASLTSPISVAMNAIGVVALSWNRAPLRLNGLELVNVLAGQNDLTQRVMQHYISAGLAEVYKVLLSFDVLGNPVGVVSALGQGVKDFFVAPAAGFAQSPAEFTKGLGKGTLSLMTNTVAGVGIGVSSLASSVGRGVAALTFDTRYVKDRAERAIRQAQHKPLHLGEGLMEGTKDLGRGLAQGIAGIVMDPLRGAEAEGVSGFVKGMGKGMVGLVVKPVAGMLDMAARTTEGMVAQARLLAGEKPDSALQLRRRTQRLLWGIDRIVIPTSTLHNVIISVMRKALEVAVTAAEHDLWADALPRSANALPVGASATHPSAKKAGGGGSNAKGGAAAKGAGASSGSGGKQWGKGMGITDFATNEALALVDDFRDIVSGRSMALRAGLSTIATSYMHHIVWPHTPYITIITTRMMILARINHRAAHGGGGGGQGGGAGGTGAALSSGLLGAPGGNQGQQIISLCWQVPVVSHAAMAIASAASALTTQDAAPADRPADALLASALGGGSEGDGPSDGSSQQRGRAGASMGVIAGHLCYTNLLDSMAQMSAEASEATELLAARTDENTAGAEEAVVAQAETRKPASGLGSGSGKPKARLRCGPPSLMALDVLVQRRLDALLELLPEHPVFALPRHILRAMTTAVDPAPLLWSDAIVTLANVRPDESPRRNVQSVTIALAYIDTAYAKYRRDRLAFLEQTPSAATTPDEFTSLQGARLLDTDDLVPVFNYLVARSSIDHPVLCAVLATTWLRQNGLNTGRDGFSINLFRFTCEWAASLPRSALSTA
jgi:hypothetical protein